jgi:hypothetical protein
MPIIATISLGVTSTQADGVGSLSPISTIKLSACSSGDGNRPSLKKVFVWREDAFGQAAAFDGVRGSLAIVEAAP